MNKYQRFMSSLLLKAVQGMALSALILAGAPLFAQDASVKNVGVYYDDGTSGNTYEDPTGKDEYKNGMGIYCNWDSITDVGKAIPSSRSFVFGPAPKGNQNQEDPWVSSALIEYDQPYPGVGADPSDPTDPNANKYPNHCLALCMDVYCKNAPVGQTTYSIAFPLQNITFDIVKYYNNKNLKNADDAPAIRSIDIYPGIDTVGLATATNQINAAKQTADAASVTKKEKEDVIKDAQTDWNTAFTAANNQCTNESSYGLACTSTPQTCSGTPSYTCNILSLTDETSKRAQASAWTTTNNGECIDPGYTSNKSAYDTAVQNAGNACSTMATQVNWSCDTETQAHCSFSTYASVYKMPADYATVSASAANWTGSCTDSGSSTITPANYAACSNCANAAEEGYCQSYYKIAYYNANIVTPDLLTINSNACTALQGSWHTPLQYSDCSSLCSDATERGNCQAYYGITHYDDDGTLKTKLADAKTACDTMMGSVCTDYQAASSAYNTAESEYEKAVAKLSSLGQVQPENYICGSYHCSNAGTSCDIGLFQNLDGFSDGRYCQNGSIGECLGAHWMCDTKHCWPSTSSKEAECYYNGSLVTGKAVGESIPATCLDGDKSTEGPNCSCFQYKAEYIDNKKDNKLEACQQQNASATTYIGCCTAAGHSDCVLFDNNGAESNKPLRFCTSWDGSHEIAGEFGKTNGNYGYRASVSTHFPGDGVAVDNIEFESTIVYPGMNQIPIQVDVTNVHTVRSTPTVVGNITTVGAQPYTFAYKISKDADVRIALFDASSSDGKAYETDNTEEFAESDKGTSPSAQERIVRELVDWQPRHGEGIKGQESDVQIQEFESWDGRNNDGLLLPAGNYIASIQAKSQDEWKGIDFSRAVTRQVSLDPLKLTDVQVLGLSKQSTAYATISYFPTEASKVYFEVYTPGTNFAGADSYANAYTLTNSSEPTGTSPHVKDGTGSLVYRMVEDKTGRFNYVSKWDGLCHAYNDDGSEKLDGTCKITYAKGERMSNGKKCQDNSCPEEIYNGAPMPDGNYVYALWAEIPYNGKYLNYVGADSSAPKFVPNVPCSGTDFEVDGQCFTGVKTIKYLIGQLPVERGLVGITMQPVSYSTVGSSPTAYGLDPFIFKYALDREADVVATIENTAGVVVKYLTPETGITQVAQQLNTLSWDGLDDQGRFVTPGTYMFKVRANDAMFPAQSNQAVTIFPVDLFRVVDVATTDVYGDSEARATISYLLSKAMNVQVNIYNKDVIIPHYNDMNGGAYEGNVTGIFTASVADVTATTLADVGVTLTTADGLKFNAAAAAGALPTDGTPLVINDTTNNVRNVWTTRLTATTPENTYEVSVTQTEVENATAGMNWPPRLCTTDDALYGVGTAHSIFDANGAVDPAKINAYASDSTLAYKPACIYVNDTTFTNYPTKANAALGNVDVRLQPVKTFDRSALKAGDGIQIMEEWDALYFYNPNDAKCKGSTDKTQCTYETVPDGQYPFYISARSDAGFNRYYAQTGDANVPATYLNGAPFKTHDEVKQEASWYATEKPIGKINVTRGPVYFLEGSVAVYPNAPQVFNASTGPTFIPPYEINFAVSRASTVEVAIVSLKDNVCSPVTPAVKNPNVNTSTQRNNKAGDICKFISTMTIANTGNFDASIIRKAYWDGTDHNGNYVKPGIYEVRLTARNYPNPSQYQATVKTIAVNADLLKVFDLLEADGYSIAQRGTNMAIGYQISVPMKVAIQIFKPGTTIYDYSKGTLRNPTTGNEVKDIHEVLVRAIVGIRPATTLINELWDGRDYAQQEVPDGTYPFRFVTALNSADIDSVTGEIIGDWATTDGQEVDKNLWKINKVADTYEYQNLHRATVAIGDGRFVCADWEKTVFFYPNPLVDASKGTLEITKMPVPGVVSIKFFNLAGDLVREGDYTCVDANNYQVQMGRELAFQPDNIVSNTPVPVDPSTGELTITNIRNAALRCKWDRTNQHGRKVARGVYFGLVDFKAKNGREHCQKVVKVLVP